ncbi:MAG: GH32 C-terminal domain-containing protein [Verrucomicrobiota bacterium]
MKSPNTPAGRTLLATALALKLAGSPVFGAPELLFENSDFESGTLKNWTVEGEAFQTQPTKGDNPKERGHPHGSEHQGDFWIGGYEAYTGKVGKPGNTRGDGPTGKLISTSFKIEKKFLNFLVGGGSHLQTSVGLLVDGKSWHLSSGFADEKMTAVSADVSRFKGQSAKLVLLDEVSGSWGHLNADHFTGSDEALGTVVEPREINVKEQSREFVVEKQYLIYPIQNGAPQPEVSLSVEGKVVRFYNAELALSQEQTDWWAFEDLSEFKGKKVILKVPSLTDEGFALIRQSDVVPGQDDWGTEPFRPQFHISQQVGWINDPNGMVYYEGKWHFFFQHNPVGLKWGNMTWGHMVSEDLVNWTQLPNQLHHRKGDAMFSGGAAVDWKNTGGWKTGDKDVVFITWTSTGRGECIAYSNDGGFTFTEYEGNPVIRHQGRDPKPVWYVYGDEDKPISDRAAELGGHWVIAVYNEDPKVGQNIAIHTSTNLKEWELQSKLPGYFECAELFPLPVDGNEEDTRWIIYAADADYAIGSFDGRTFKPEHEGKYKLHHSRGFNGYYASQLFSDAPGDRRIQIGWLRDLNAGGIPFSQGFSFPTELTLRKTAKGVRMFGNPVGELEKIHGETSSLSGKTLKQGAPVRLTTSGGLLDVSAELKTGGANRISIGIDGNKSFVYDAQAATLDGAPVTLIDGALKVRILIDRGIIEVFANDGEAVITSSYANDLEIDTIEISAEGGDAELVKLEVTRLEAKH